ncbi:MAG: hypothetical protein AB7U81_07390 [Thiohalomonadaceae bacterium]
MPGSGRTFRQGLRTALLLALLCLGPAVADEQSERRILVGLKLFPAVLAADRDIALKAAPDGRLHLLVVYLEDPEVARRAAERLREAGPIRDIPVVVQTIRYSALATLEHSPAALFLVEWSPESIPATVAFANTHGRIVFSPFRGDVSLGAHAGVFVGDRILPLINPTALSQAGIQLKPFFLEVARTRE